MRALCHAQNLLGVGHFVRMHLIAAGLAAAHDVYLTDGGRRVPRRTASAEPRRLPLSALTRDRSGRVVDGRGRPAAATIRGRAQVLDKAARAIRPDVVLVDQYPFSKWDLAPEIEALVTTARRANPGVRILCSLRDLVPQTPWETVGPAEYAEQVLRRLEELFDGVLMHSDPAFARLEDSFPRAGSVPVPVHYTGYVAEPAAPPPPGAVAPWGIIAGGGTATTPFLASVVGAFARLSGAGCTGETRLHVFQGPAADAGDAETLRRAAAGAPVHVHPFSTDYAAWLQGAAFSISHAGYNTTTALLRARVPALVVPNPRVSDQVLRAARLEAAGLAAVIEGGESPAPAPLAEAMGRLLSAPRPCHDLDFDGVAATRRLVEASRTQPSI